jgi:HEAT repeat protein
MILVTDPRKLLRAATLLLLTAAVPASTSGQARTSKPNPKPPAPQTAKPPAPQSAKPKAESRPGAISVDEAILLTNGWALMAEGRPQEASARAAKVLAAYPRSAAGIALAVEAEIASGGFTAGYARYESWLGQRLMEEPSIVRRLAVASLWATALDERAEEARVEALRALANDRDEAAHQLLSNAALKGGMPELRVLASRGNDFAVKALASDLEKGGVNPVASIEALAASGSELAVPVLVKRLRDPSPEVRGAAVEGLGKLARSYLLIDQIKPSLQDPVSFVRVRAAAALFGLGDQSGVDLLQKLLAEDSSMSRLVALQSMASLPDPQWQDQVRRLTSASEPEIRVGAAKLLLPHDPETARRVLEAAVNDPNPAIREMAGDLGVDVPATDLRTLRYLLRSTAALARTRAAARILTTLR